MTCSWPSVGLWVYVLTKLVRFNLHWRPWEGCRYQHEAAAAILELVSCMKAGDVFSSWLTPEILGDWVSGAAGTRKT